MVCLIVDEAILNIEARRRSYRGPQLAPGLRRDLKEIGRIRGIGFTTAKFEKSMGVIIVGHPGGKAQMFTGYMQLGPCVLGTIIGPYACMRHKPSTAGLHIVIG